MYRVLQGNPNKVSDATFVAGEDMKRGMLGLKGTDGEVNFPSVATDKDVFLISKEFIVSGENGDRDLPDYDDVFENIKEGENIVLEKPISGERYFTDQTTGTIEAGDYLLVGTDGKLVATTVASKFLVTNEEAIDSGTHSGIAYSVLD